MIKQLKQFTTAVDSLAQLFCKKYFDNTEDWYWISDEREGVLSVGDYFFNLEDIVTSIRYNATEKQVFEWYDMLMDSSVKNKPLDINYRNYLKYGKIKK